MNSLTNSKTLGVAIFAFILLALAGIFYYVNYQATSDMQPSYHNSNWKTATLEYEKITYQYPPSWSVTNQSRAMPKAENYCSYPGEDSITLTSPTKAQVFLEAGQVCPGPEQSKTWGSVPTTAFGSKAYLVFQAPLDVQKLGPTRPTRACLSTATNPKTASGYESKNIFVNHSVVGNALAYNMFCYIPPQSSSQQIERSADWNTAKQIFETMHY